MGTFTKNNKIVSILIAVLLVLLGSGSFGAESDQSNSVTFGDKVFSFETLDKAEKFEDLVNYGLLAPDQYNHTSGRNLVMLALNATSYFKGDWVRAHGLLGVTMLDVGIYDSIAYRSLFLSLSFPKGYKMYANYLADNSLLYSPFILGEKLKTDSIITKREAAITAAAWELHGRYTYNKEGNFGRNYFPEPKRKSNEKLKIVLSEGMNVYKGLKSRGYDDKTLRDTLGMVYASLVFDGAYSGTELEYLILGTHQVYLDTLKATLERLKKAGKEHSLDFLEELAIQMILRDLAANEKILLPTTNDTENFQAILKIIEKDLDSIQKH